jgi:inner membrane protein involved in colicin E2 resistance
MSLEKLSVRRFMPPLLSKALLIGFLIILLLVPLGRMEDLVGERVGMRQEAAQRVASSSRPRWGARRSAPK